MKNATEKLKARISNPINDKPEERKFLFQFVNHENGTRSKPFTGTWDDVQEVLDHREDGERPMPNDYILLVAVIDGENTQIPSTPLITVATFQKMLSNEEPK